MRGDVLSIESYSHDGEQLIVPVMRGGKRLAPPESLADIRARAARALAHLPLPLARLEPGHDYPVTISGALTALAREADRLAAG
jgi:nicotinate phosphoribosyltransferase